MKVGPTRFSRNMVILKQGVRLNDDGLAALDALGKVTDVIRLAGHHGMDDPFYKHHYGAKVWAMPKQRYFAGVNPAKDASLYVIDTKPCEGILRLDAADGTLIVGDSLQNWGAGDAYFNWLGKTALRMMELLRPHQLGPAWLKACRPKTWQNTTAGAVATTLRVARYKPRGLSCFYPLAKLIHKIPNSRL